MAPTNPLNFRELCDVYGRDSASCIMWHDREIENAADWFERLEPADARFLYQTITKPTPSGPAGVISAAGIKQLRLEIATGVVSESTLLNMSRLAVIGLFAVATRVRAREIDNAGK